MIHNLSQYLLAQGAELSVRVNSTHLQGNQLVGTGKSAKIESACGDLTSSGCVTALQLKRC